MQIVKNETNFGKLVKSEIDGLYKSRYIEFKVIRKFTYLFMRWFFWDIWCNQKSYPAKFRISGESIFVKLLFYLQTENFSESS